MWFGMQSLKHNPNGRFVVVCGDGEYIIYTALAWRNRSFGSALEFAWSTDGEYAVRESTSKIKIFNKTFQVGSHAWNLLLSSSSLRLPHDLCLESWLCILSVRKWKGADLLPLQMDRAYYLSRDVHFVHCMSSVQERKSIRPNISADGIYGGALLAVRSSEFICFYDWVECRVIRRIDVVAKVGALCATGCMSL
jgi:hypothetical protein